MNADANEVVLVRRHSAFNTMQQPLFFYSPGSGNIQAATKSAIDSETSGWLIDFERVFDGDKRIIFYRYDDRKFVSLGNSVFEIGADQSAIIHKKGKLLSELKVIDTKGIEHSVKYLTPWWRLIFDDGSHPDLHFPLEVFTKQFSS